MASEIAREPGIHGNPCVPMFLLDPEGLKYARKPVPKIGLFLLPALLTLHDEKQIHDSHIACHGAQHVPIRLTFSRVYARKNEKWSHGVYFCNM